MKHLAVRLSLLLCLLCAVPIFAQTADVSGTVTDPSGAVIPKASVRILNENTLVERDIKTNNDGVFSAPSIQPGVYRIFVEAPGFSTEAINGVKIDVAAQINLPIHLRVGSQQQTINVNGSGLQINTTDASVSTVIDRKFVQNIPLNGRSFQDLILLTPGVETVNPNAGSTSGANGEFSVNGQRTESNMYTVDGVSANTGGFIYGYSESGTSGSLPAATALGTTQSLVAVDALQEFKVASSSYSAEYGLSPGGQFSFATRSGTNVLRGTTFDYLRNNYFDANDWFNDTLGEPISAERQNDFGGTLDGPIRIPLVYDGRNKSFFFFSYEGLRLTQPQAAETEYVPSAELRESVAGPLQSALNAFPQQSAATLPNGLAPFVQVDSLPSAIDSPSFRIDQELGARLKLFFRFADTQSSTKNRTLSELTTIEQGSKSSTLGVTSILSQNSTDDLRVNYTSGRGGSSSFLDGFGGAQPADLRTLQGLTPAAEAGIFLNFPGYQTELADVTTTQPQHAWDLVDSLVLSHERQTIKTGISFRQIGSHFQYPSPYVFSLFNSSQAVTDNSSYYSFSYAYARSYPVYTNTALYIQDEIRTTSRLALSLGLRWEVNPPPTQSSGPLPYIATGDLSNLASLQLAPVGTKFWKTTYFNLAPRLGAAWQIRQSPEWETVFRVGGGVYFDSGQQTSTQPFGRSVGQSASAIYSNVSYPLTASQVAVQIATPPKAPYSEIFYFPDRLQLPYTLQWNVSLEQALGKSQAMTFSYVGSNGRRLLWQRLITPGAAAPDFGEIYDEGSGSTSSYNAFQAKFERTISTGLQVLASYNWAHSIDFGSQDIDFAQTRGNSDYDLRQNFNIATSYEIPNNAQNPVARQLLSRWGVDGRFSTRTAFPIILDGNEITDPNGSFGYSGLNIVPGAAIYLHASGLAGNRRINPDAFSLPALDETGDAPRNFVRGFGATQLDLAARRTFSIFKDLNLQFRAEVFNILNHPNFGYIQPTYGNVQFGEATKMLNQSLGGLSPLYQQGGPRSMQFAAKFEF
jgi:hypothetical protein